MAATSTQNNGNGADRLEVRYVRLGDVRKWNRNPKKHDIGALVESIRKHGFKVPPRYEPTLNNGQGGLIAGNGRDEALEWMFKQEPQNPPRGIAIDHDGTWLIPVLFGVDAVSQAAAEAYGIDDNNMTMMGGDFGAFDLSKMWNEDEYNTLLLDLAQQNEYSISIPADTLVFLNNAGNQLVDYYKNRDNVREVDAALTGVLALKVLLLVRSRKHEQEAMEGIKALIATHPEWEMEIA
jgi:hypothetical protein